jgi:hypothetical protein
MQQRRLRLGDILDDYCPRERRITNHAVVAMIDDEVKQTRCTTCDAEHEYKQARVPPSRRRKPGAQLPDVPAGLPEAPMLAGGAAPAPQPHDEDVFLPPERFLETADPEPDAAPGEPEPPEVLDDDGPVHRPLIRATLPRPEGQAPERKAPDFTIRQPGGRFDQRNGQRNRGRHARQGQGSSPGQGPAQRFGTPRHGEGQRQGNRTGQAPGSRGGRPHGPNRGQRQGGGQGRKRGR